MFLNLTIEQGLEKNKLISSLMLCNIPKALFVSVTYRPNYPNRLVTLIIYQCWWLCIVCYRLRYTTPYFSAHFRHLYTSIIYFAGSVMRDYGNLRPLLTIGLLILGVAYCLSLALRHAPGGNLYRDYFAWQRIVLHVQLWRYWVN